MCVRVYNMYVLVIKLRSHLRISHGYANVHKIKMKHYWSQEKRYFTCTVFPTKQRRRQSLKRAKNGPSKAGDEVMVILHL